MEKGRKGIKIGLGSWKMSKVGFKNFLHEVTSRKY